MSLMKYTCLILLLSVFSPLYSQSFKGMIDGITYYENLDFTNLPINIKNLEFATGIPVELSDSWLIVPIRATPYCPIIIDLLILVKKKYAGKIQKRADCCMA